VVLVAVSRRRGVDDLDHDPSNGGGEETQPTF
jgi:hypothetical protein